MTGDTHLITFKYVDAVPIHNFIRLLITTNHAWAVPVGLRGRRFAVWRVGEDHIGDKPYFAALDAQMDHGGREALLYFLLNYDYSQIDLRSVPLTEALLEQKRFSMEPEAKWWLEVLNSGRIPARREIGGGTAYSKEDLYKAYIEHAGMTGARYRAVQTQLGSFLKGHVPGLHNKQKRKFRNLTTGRVGTGKGWSFPTLETCRAAFEKKMGQAFPWEDGNDERYWE